MKDCVFCEKIKGVKEVEWLGNGVVTFEPLNPVTKGHRLFVSVDHVENFTQDPLITAQVMRAASMYYMGKGGQYNLITSQGRAATQTVRHLHVHVVPRMKGDGLTLPWTGQKI